MADTTKPDLPEMHVKPVANGFIVRVPTQARGAPANLLTIGAPGVLGGANVVREPDTVYVARSYAELCRLLKHIAVRDKLT